MILNFAHIWDVVSEAAGSRLAAINGDKRLTWRDYERRAARLASALKMRGIGPESKVALYAFNCNEYLEAQYAAFKLRAVPINVNYRYTGSELAYLLDDADAEALIFEARFAPVVADIRAKLPKLRLFVEIKDETGLALESAEHYEALIAEADPLPRGGCSSSDVYMIYTGGTTGMPKGVVYQHGDIVPTMLAGYDLRGRARPDSDRALAAAVAELAVAGEAPIALVACPMMHGAGMWSGVMMPHNLGGTVVSIRDKHFDAHRLWQIAALERVSEMAIVGDAFARPMLAALLEAEARGQPYHLPALRFLFSSGVIFSQDVKNELVSRLNVTIVDSAGSSEGHVGASVTTFAKVADTARFMQMPSTKVFTDDDREVVPGSNEIGRLASGGLVPRAYYKDPAKSAATFRIIGGHRYSFSGDYARVNADGSFVLLGRGSNCINSGGEKIFPEEVEEAIKTLPGVADALVVGVPDDRLGHVPAAVIALHKGVAADDVSVMTGLRQRLAGYKLPRRFRFAERIERGPNGKPDYNWARRILTVL